MFFHILLGLFDGFLDGQSVQGQVAVRSHIRTRRVADDTFFGIEAFFAYVTTFYQRADFESEMLGKSIVAAIVGGYGHDGSCAVSCQYVIADPDGHCFTCKRIDGIRTAENTGNAAVGDTFAFRTFLGAVKVGIYFCFLGGSGQLGYQFTFRSQYHKGHTEHGICTGSKDGKFEIAVFYLELYFGTFGASDPVLLSFFQ